MIVDKTNFFKDVKPKQLCLNLSLYFIPLTLKTLKNFLNDYYFRSKLVLY